MKKLNSSLTNMVVVLTSVAVITGALLAWVNHVTAASIKIQAAKTLSDGIKEVMGVDNLTVSSTDTITKKYRRQRRHFCGLLHLFAKRQEAAWRGR